MHTQPRPSFFLKGPFSRPALGFPAPLLFSFLLSRFSLRLSSPSGERASVHTASLCVGKTEPYQLSRNANICSYASRDNSNQIPGNTRGQNPQGREPGAGAGMCAGVFVPSEHLAPFSCQRPGSAQLQTSPVKGTPPWPRPRSSPRSASRPLCPAAAIRASLLPAGNLTAVLRGAQAHAFARAGPGRIASAAVHLEFLKETCSELALILCKSDFPGVLLHCHQTTRRVSARTWQGWKLQLPRPARPRRGRHLREGRYRRPRSESVLAVRRSRR